MLFLLLMLVMKVAQLSKQLNLGIPIIGVVDTNNSIDDIAYVIPGNDDSSRAIRLYARGIADAVLEGRKNAIDDLAKMVKEEDPVKAESKSEKE